MPIDFASELGQASTGFTSAITSAAGSIGSSLVGGGGMNFMSLGLNILKPLLGGLFGGGFGGFFAEGGSPPVGLPSLVGEKGPELIVPRSSMMVVPTKKLPGSKGIGMTEQQKIARSFQQLEADSAMTGPPLDINYTVTATNEQRYVTERQFQHGINMATKQAEARVLSRMQNSRMTRDNIGMRS